MNKFLLIPCNGAQQILKAGQKYVFRLWGHNSISSSWLQLGSDDCITLMEEDYCKPSTRYKAPKDSLVLINNKPEEFCEIIPNPMSNYGTLHYNSLHEKNDLVVYDLYGNIVFKVKLTEKEGVISLDLSTLKQGVYQYLLLSGKRQSNTRKLIIIR